MPPSPQMQQPGDYKPPRICGLSQTESHCADNVSPGRRAHAACALLQVNGSGGKSHAGTARRCWCTNRYVSLHLAVSRARLLPGASITCKQGCTCMAFGSTGAYTLRALSQFCQHKSSYTLAGAGTHVPCERQTPSLLQPLPPHARPPCQLHPIIPSSPKPPHAQNGASQVRCSRCGHATPDPFTAPRQGPTAQAACHGCRVVLTFPMGAPSVQCSLCQTVTQVGLRAPGFGV